MPESKISALTELTALADGDLFVVVDVSDTTMAATGTDKKIQASNLSANPVPTLVIPGDDTYQLDPPNAPHDCTILYTSDYGDGGHFTLPATANSPEAGTRYFIVVKPSTSGDAAFIELRKASAANLATSYRTTADRPIHMTLTYLGSNVWAWDILNDDNTPPITAKYGTNAD